MLKTTHEDRRSYQTKAKCHKKNYMMKSSMMSQQKTEKQIFDEENHRYSKMKTTNADSVRG